MSKKLSKRHYGFLVAVTVTAFLFQNCSQPMDPGESYRNRDLASTNSEVKIGDSPTSGGVGTGGSNDSGNTDGQAGESGGGSGGEQSGYEDIPANLPPPVEGTGGVPVLDPSSGSPDSSPAVTANCTVVYQYHSDLYKPVEGQLKAYSLTLQNIDNALEDCAFYYNQHPGRDYVTATGKDYWQRMELSVSVPGKASVTIKNTNLPHRPRVCVAAVKSNLNNSTQSYKRMFRTEQKCKSWVESHIAPNYAVSGTFDTKALPTSGSLTFSRGGAGDKACVVEYVSSNNVLVKEKYTGDSSFTKDKCLSYYTAKHNVRDDETLMKFSFAGTSIDVTTMTGAKECDFVVTAQPAAFQNSVATKQVNRFYFADSCTAWKNETATTLGTGTQVSSTATVLSVQINGVNSLVGEVSNLGFMGQTGLAW